MPVSRIVSLSIVALFLGVAPVEGQQAGLTIELHGGASVPVGVFSDTGPGGEGVAAGPSLGAAFVLPGSGRRGMYVGFTQHHFGCEDAGCASGGSLVATGFDAGLRFKLLTGRSVTPWIRIGAITTRVESDDLGGANVGVSKLGIGGEVGAGLYIGSEGSFALNPGIRYAFVDSELPGGTTLSMRYLVAQVALVVAF